MPLAFTKQWPEERKRSKTVFSMLKTQKSKSCLNSIANMFIIIANTHPIPL